MGSSYRPENPFAPRAASRRRYRYENPFASEDEKETPPRLAPVTVTPPPALPVAAPRDVSRVVHPGGPDPNAPLSLPERVVAGTGRMVYETVRHPLRTAASIADVTAGAALAAFQAPVVGERIPEGGYLSAKIGTVPGAPRPGSRVAAGTPGAVTRREMLLGQAATIANVAAGPVQRNVSAALVRRGVVPRLAAAAGAAAAGAPIGASFSPDDPLAGAFVGAAGGAALPMVLEGAKRVTEPLIRRAARGGAELVRRYRPENPFVRTEAPARAEPAVTPPAERPASGVGVPEGGVEIVRVPTADVHTDPERFQYKRSVDRETGTGGELKGLTKFDESLAGVISVWRDPADGNLYAVNGHHRIELAKRTGHPSVNVQVLPARDASEARAMGAIANIAEGRGTAVDAATFFRNSKVTPEGLADRISFKGAIARRGSALARLAPDVFDRVVRGDVPEDYGVAIGTMLEDPVLQRTAARAAESSSKRLSEGEVRELARQVQDAGTEITSQETLFGEEQIANALWVEKAQLAEALEKRLTTDKRLFGYVAKEGRAEELARGGNLIDVESSRNIAEDAARLTEAFQQMYTRSGPVAQALTEGARRLARGESLKTIAGELYATVREHLRTALPGGGAAGGALPGARDQIGEPPAGPDAAGRQVERGPAPPATAEEVASPVPSAPNAAEAISRAETGRPFAATLLRGSGREGTPYSERSAGLPVLGEGRYSTPSREYAEWFGPNVTTLDVRLQNPLVVTSDDQWRNLTRRAGWTFPNPTGVPPEELAPLIQRFRNVVEGMGHDGIVVRLPRIAGRGLDERTGKLLDRVFGEDQVVEFAPPQPTPPDPNQQALLAPRGEPARFRAAIKLPNGKVFEGQTHWDAVQAALTAGDLPEGFERGPAAFSEGFTLGGRYLTREQADRLATDVPRRNKGFLGAEDLRAADRIEAPGSEEPLLAPRESSGPDLFGESRESAADQASMFAGNEGSAASRPLSRTERAAQAELELVEMKLRYTSTPKARQALYAKKAELERLLNRGEKISGAELTTRLRAGEAADVPVIPTGPDQQALFSPAADKTALGKRAKRLVGMSTAETEDVLALRRISERFMKALDLPFRQGRGNLAQRGAAGAFWPHSESVRIVRKSWVDTAAHEAGHYLSKKYAIKAMVRLVPDQATRGRMRAELLAMGKDLYGSRKPAGGYAEEGVAQAIRFYVTEPARLASDAPTFVNVLEQLLSREPALKQVLDWSRTEYDRFQRAPAETKLAAMIVSDVPRAHPVSARDFVRLVLDDLEPVKHAVATLGGADDITRDAYVLARVSRSAGPAQYALRHGVHNVKGEPLSAGLEPILQMIPDAERSAWTRYLVAERAIELEQRGIASGMDMGAAREVAVAGRARADYVAAAKAVYEYQDALLQLRVDTGLLSEDAARVIRRQNERRVPFQRLFEDEEPVSGGSIGGRKLTKNFSGVHRIKGSDRPILDPLESIVRETYDTYAQTRRQAAFNALAGLSLEREGGARVMEVLPEAPQDVKAISVKDAIAQLNEKGFVVSMDEQNPPTPEALGEMLLNFVDKTRAGPNETKDMVLPVLYKGERRWVQLYDRKLFDLFAGLDRLEMGAAGRVLSAPTRVLRLGATQWNPDFALGFNLVRDASEMFVYSRGPTRAPGYHLARGLFHLVRSKLGTPDELAEMFYREGGTNAGMVGADRRSVMKAYEGILDEATRRRRTRLMQTVRHPLRTAATVFELGENGTRAGEMALVYEQQRAAGVSHPEAQLKAIMAAREGTLDYQQVGQATRIVNQIYAFTNAYVRDLERFAREHNPKNLATEAGRRRMATVVTRAVAGITMSSVTLWLLQKDDPAYQEVPDWVKQIGWVVVDHEGGVGKSFTLPVEGKHGETIHVWVIPRPFLLGMVYGYLPERLLDWWNGKDPDAIRRLHQGFTRALTPVETVVPHALVPIVENYGNRRYFSGAPVVPEGAEDLPPFLQAAPSTGETARLGARMLKDTPLAFSPAKAENLLYGYTGGLGRTIGGAIDVGVRTARKALGEQPLAPERVRPGDILPDIPVVRRFHRDVTGAQARSVTDVLEAFERAESHRRAWEALLKEGRPEEAREYLRAHRAEILSVMTQDESPSGEMGPLRATKGTLDDLFDQRKRLRGLAGQVPDSTFRRLSGHLDDLMIGTARQARAVVPR